MSKTKRHVQIAVVSDVHLGTYGCRAGELLQYLKSIDPEVLILNGDIIDIWQFRKNYFPQQHLKVIKYILGRVVKGKRVVYVTGNHDEMMRKFRGFQLGNFEIVNKLLLDVDGKQAWIFHGDVFDVTMKNSKWLAKLGGLGYDFLIRLNTVVNWASNQIGRGRISLSKKIKNSVKRAVQYIDDFEMTAARIAIDNGYDYVICGHIHQPQHRYVTGEDGRGVTYLNSGDWIENLTALEYAHGEWTVYEHQDETEQDEAGDPTDLLDLTHEMVFAEMLREFEALEIAQPA